MSTLRYYFDPAALPASSPAYDASWDDIDGAGRRVLRDTAYLAATSAAEIVGVSEAVIGTRVMLGRQYVRAAPTGLISGSMRAVLRTSASFASSSVDYLRVVIRVVSADLSTVRGTLFAGLSSAEIPTPANLATRTVSGVLTPVTAQPGDLLVVEIGATGSLSSGTSSGSALYLGGASPGAVDYAFADGLTSSDVPWVELILPDPPNPPTGHTVTAVEQTQISTSWTAPATGTAPTGYDVRVDGGAATAVGNVLAHTFTGLTVATTYTLEVRATNPNGASAWVPVSATTDDPQPSAPGIASQAILAAAGLNPNPNGADAPAQQWWDVDSADVATYNDVRSEGLFSYSIGYASREPLGKPQPLGIGVVLLVPVADAVAIGDRFQLRLGDALADALGLDLDAAVRATCIVTDVLSDPTRTWHLPGHGPATLWNVTATGWLSRYGAARIDGTAWPVEPVGARIARVLDSLGLTGDVDTLGADVLPPQTVGTHHQALAPAVDSALGRLIEQRDGTVDYSDPGDRRGRTPVLTLDAAEIIGENFSWRQSVSDVVNSAEVAYGTDTGSSVVVADPASADPRTGVGPYPQQISTVLADELDAYSLGNDLVGRRAWPYYQLPAVTVDLARSGLDLTRLAVAFAILNGDRVALTSMPAGSPWDTLPRGCFIEGYTETATAYAWRLTLVVSDPALSGVSLRYIDVTAGIAYDDVAAGISYLDVARIEDPADLL